MGVGVGLPRVLTDAPRIVRGLLRAAMVILALVVLAVATHGCDPVREGVMRVAAGVPPRADCAEGTQRCSAAVPEVCSRSGRWWPSLPPRTDGTPRVCAGGCAVIDVPDAGPTAQCMDPIDGGAR